MQISHFVRQRDSLPTRQLGFLGYRMRGQIELRLQELGIELPPSPTPVATLFQIPYLREEERRSTACYCGKYGCIETFLSGAGLVADYTQSTGDKLSSEEVAVRAANDDEMARATLNRYVDRLTRALSCVINILDPDVIVLGGGVSNSSSLYPDIPELWRTHVFNNEVNTTLRQASPRQTANCLTGNLITDIAQPHIY